MPSEWHQKLCIWKGPGKHLTVSEDIEAQRVQSKWKMGKEDERQGIRNNERMFNLINNQRYTTRFHIHLSVRQNFNVLERIWENVKS
jgi:hypothetical protein